MFPRSIIFLLMLGLSTLIVHAETDPQEMDKQAEASEPFDNDKKGKSEGDTDDDDDENRDPSELKDPLEPLNRFTFGVHQRVDGAIIRPIAQVYDDITPQYMKDSVGNFMDNLLFPIDFVNFVLQGRFKQAGTSLFRFLANSTMGVLGIFDAGTELGLEKENTGFGDTLGGWGMEAGPYLFIPVMGPTTFRGGIGMAADYFGHPLYLWTVNKKVHRRSNKHHQWYHWYIGKQVLEGVHKRSKLLNTLDDLEAESLDYYLAIRSLHGQQIQSKQDQIRADRLKYMDGTYLEEDDAEESTDADKENSDESEDDDNKSEEKNNDVKVKAEFKEQDKAEKEDNT